LKVYAGGDAYYNSCTHLGSGSTTINDDQWYHMCFDFYLHDTNGWATLWVDGTSEVDFDGDTLYNSVSTCNRIYLANPQDGGAADRWNIAYVDDFIYWTHDESDAAFSEQLRLEWLEPDADGNYTGWTASGGSDHYLDIDESPKDDDTTYVSAAAAATRDSYTVEDTSDSDGQVIEAVVPVAYAKHADGTETLTPSLRLSSTDDDGDPWTLTTSYARYFQEFATKPGGGSWSSSDVDSTELGLLTSGTF
jgi:hypothetical protein